MNIENWTNKIVKNKKKQKKRITTNQKKTNV